MTNPEGIQWNVCLPFYLVERAVFHGLSRLIVEANQIRAAMKASLKRLNPILNLLIHGEFAVVEPHEEDHRLHVLSLCLFFA
jgi:hypothetical protein